MNKMSTRDLKERRRVIMDSQIIKGMEHKSRGLVLTRHNNYRISLKRLKAQRKREREKCIEQLMSQRIRGER